MLKRCFLGTLCLIASLAACSGAKAAGGTSSAAPDTEQGSISYAFGVVMASQFKGSGLTFDYDAYAQGFKEYLEGTEKVTYEEAMITAQTAFQTATTTQAEEQRKVGVAFLAENSKKDGITVTASGLQYKRETEGSGAKPVAEDTVRVHYEGKLIDGTVFDSSYQRGEPVEFPLNQVIPGWTEGLQLMNEGSTYLFYIPSELAYGEQPNQVIPPNSVLIFKVELLAIVK
ncbi:MAG: FKBP-type peptidyl-prolyl cis-trans isomerase [Treponema sp.]|jgi:FKBP-type peptidyl-prolyl cis-trans isomerase|nr:FKBP-type peptidyl-prolyl cis-trans isomerase [Treponema sp.]